MAAHPITATVAERPPTPTATCSCSCRSVEVGVPIITHTTDYTLLLSLPTYYWLLLPQYNTTPNTLLLLLGFLPIVSLASLSCPYGVWMCRCSMPALSCVWKFQIYSSFPKPNKQEIRRRRKGKARGRKKGGKMEIKASETGKKNSQ